MKVEQALFTLRIRPGLSAEQWNEVASAICRILIDPPQSPRHRRAIAVRQALSVYEGPPSRRAKELERHYATYLASGWRLERDSENLPHPRSTERACLHRIARLSGGRSLSWSTILRDAAGAL